MALLFPFSVVLPHPEIMALLPGVGDCPYGNEIGLILDVIDTDVSSFNSAISFGYDMYFGCC